MFDISLETANVLYRAGWIGSLVGATVTAIGVISLWAGTRIRDADTEAQLAATHEKSAGLEFRAEELRAQNLKLEREIVDLTKNVRGREITSEQRDKVVRAMTGVKVPDLVTYIVYSDPETRWYGMSLVMLFKELGMRGRAVLLDHAPAQTGVMFCGTGTPEDKQLMEVLMNAGIVGVGAWAPQWPLDKDGKELEPPYCPRGSIFVGLRQPLSNLYSPQVLKGLAPHP